MPKVSIIMPYWNRGMQLDRTLESIARQDVKNLEVVLVPDSRKRSDQVWLNPAPLWNEGLRRATGDILILQSPECLHFQNDTIARLCEVEKGFALFANVMAVNRNGLNDHWYCHHEHRPVPWFFCGSIHRETLGDVRFDESFKGYGGEDIKFASDLEKAGVRFTWNDKTFVEHQWHEFTGGVELA